MEIADILDKAADLIEPEGRWIQGEYHDHRDGISCWCAMGAVARVMQENEADAEYLLDRQASLIGFTSMDLEEFNDAEGRAQAEVVAKLREAAAKARGEQVPA